MLHLFPMPEALLSGMKKWKESHLPVAVNNVKWAYNIE